MSSYLQPTHKLGIFDNNQFIRQDKKIDLEYANKTYVKKKSGFNIISSINKYLILPESDIESTNNKKSFINQNIADKFYASFLNQNIFLDQNTFNKLPICDISEIPINDNLLINKLIGNKLYPQITKNNFFTQDNNFKKIVAEEIFINDQNIVSVLVNSASLIYENIFTSINTFNLLPVSYISSITNNFQLINSAIANSTYGRLSNNNIWTSINYFNDINVNNNLIINNVNFFTILSTYANLSSNNTFTQINNFNGGLRSLGSLFFGSANNLNYFNLNSIFGILDYVSENSHNFYVSSINIISIALNSVTFKKKIIIEDNTLLTPTEGNLIFKHSASVGESSICFQSGVNTGSDYAYIKYVDNYNDVIGEKSRLIIGVENDITEDAIVLKARVGINTSGSVNSQLHVEGDIYSSSNISGTNITGNNIYGNNIFINGFNILDLLVAYARTSLNNNFSGINTFTGATTNFTNITVSIISKVLTIYYGTIGEFYMGLNPNNGYFSYFSTGHAFYAESQGILSISESGLSMSNNKPINATTINVTTLNCENLNISNQLLLQNRMMFRIQNINNVMTIVYETDNTILVNYVQTTSKLKKIQSGSYILSLNATKVTNNNYFISFNSTYNNSQVASSVMNTSYTIKDDLYSSGILYSKVCNITITRGSALSDVLSNSQGYIEGLITY